MKVQLIKRRIDMKKIINGKTYNTATAILIAEEWNGLSVSDFNYCSESLYKTKKGAYFLYGDGGPNSKYSKSVGQNTWSGGEAIEPLTEKEARQWLSDNDFIDEYETEFGLPEEA